MQRRFAPVRVDQHIGIDRDQSPSIKS
jgi:hypothetical protein